LRNKVIIDLFAAPAAVIPAAIGVSMMILGWALGGGGFLGFAGFIALMAGLGVGATRFFLFKDKIINAAYAALDTLQEQEKTAELDDLDQKLRRDKDPRTQAALRDMRALYAAFHQQVRDSTIKADHKTTEGVEVLFQECVSHLGETLTLNGTIRSMTSDVARRPIQEAREGLIAAVQDTINRLSSIMDGLRQLAVQANTDEMQRVQSELEAGLEVSKQVDNALRGAGKSDYSWLKNRMKQPAEKSAE
tara:strand:- start:13322 stop:14065 length:744 start_codon:yes stop_codon:yes gene_type:complete